MANTPISQIPNGQAISPVSALAVYTIDGGVIGSTTPKAGTFTTLTATSLTATTVSAATPILVSNGGTGLATLTANNVILGNGTSTPTFVAPGSSGNLLTSNGTTWTSATPSASSSAMVKLSTLSASGSSSIDFTSTYVNATYTNYRLIISNLVAATDNTNALLYTSVGGNFATASYGYSNLDTTTTTTITHSNNDSLVLLGSAISNNSSGNSGNAGFIIDFMGVTTSNSCQFSWSGSSMASGGTVHCWSGAGQVRAAGNPVDGIRIKMNSGNITSGTFTLYGIT